MVRRVAIAGATGYTGQRLLAELGHQALWDGRALVRPGSEHKLKPAPGQDMAVCSARSVDELLIALKGCAAVIQTIGTTRAQFAPGISYETVDYATTVALVAAAQELGIKRFLLLSSVGAGKPVGPYLQWKARTEQVVRQSGLNWTILRPAAIVGPLRRLMHIGSLPFALLSRLPDPLGAVGYRYRPINVTLLAECFIRCLDDADTIGKILEGRALWNIVKA